MSVKSIIRNSCLLVVIWACFILEGCSGQDVYTLKGNIKGADGKAYLIYMDDIIQQDIVDSLVIVDGKINHTGHVDMPTVAVLLQMDNGGLRYGEVATMVLENKHLKIKGNMDKPFFKAAVNGSKLNTIFNKYKKDIIPNYQVRMAKSSSQEQLLENNEKMLDKLWVLAEKNTDNIIGVWAFSQVFPKLKSYDQLEKWINRFSDEMRKTPLLKSVIKNAPYYFPQFEYAK